MSARWHEVPDHGDRHDHASCLEVGAVILAGIGAVYLVVRILFSVLMGLV